MSSFKRQGTAKKWARFALKVGLLLTDAKMWASVSEKLRDRADDMGDEVKRRYEDTTDRLSEAHDALHGRSRWVAPAMNFIGGVGIGVGLGILLAPVSGEETRSAIRDKVVDIKNKVGDLAADATGLRAREVRSSATGTD